MKASCDLGFHFLSSPEPFVLTAQEIKFLNSLGGILGKFYEVCDELYRGSAKGKIVPWLAPLLDAGKPDWLIQLQREGKHVGMLPRVIRPDLMLMEKGFAISELDSVPGGMGVTYKLAQEYAEKGWKIVGGETGMAEGFKHILPEGADIIVSQESSDYRSELNYFVGALGEKYALHEAEGYSPAGGKSIYRFFELFDCDNIPGSCDLLKQYSLSGELTPPAKPHLEEKLWLALFRLPGLRPLWKQRLREAHRLKLEQIIPEAWIPDREPLPPQAALPYLDVGSWDEVGDFSQKERRLVLKISGFHELAWGARGVYIGHDMPSAEWKEILEKARDGVKTHPWIMQRFMEGRVVDHPYYDEDTGEVKMMQGRVRLCPYYFRNISGKIILGGALATIVPSDKKKIHGMRDGILVPASSGRA